VPSSQIDEAVRVFNNTARVHLFENVKVDDVIIEVCRHCGKAKDDVRKAPGSYDYHPCRGLVG
jgi:hypothetical protein